jgi:hypothetical protein
MLRQIVSTSLVLVTTTCVTFISTKVNAALIVFTNDSLEKDQGESITFKVSFDPMLADPTDTVRFDSVIPLFDATELSYNSFGSKIEPAGTLIYGSTTVAEFKFDVLPPKPHKDGASDISRVILTYFFKVGTVEIPIVIGVDPLFDVVPKPVPEPLTMFGTAIGLGCGVLFKRKFSKKTVC